MSKIMDDIKGDSIEFLLSQFKGKEKVEGLIQASVSDLQEIENDIWQWRDSMNIETAGGVFLDFIGALVGISRSGREDEEYRTRIYAQIGINTSHGTLDDIASVFNLLTGGTRTDIVERYPCVITLTVNADLGETFEDYGEDAFAFDGGTDGLGWTDGHFSTSSSALIDNTSLYDLMEEVIAGGVRIAEINYYTNEAFAFEGGTDGLGFGEGEFATSI